jgi:predicted RNA-binding Zn ribbon-like protein
MTTDSRSDSFSFSFDLDAGRTCLDFANTRDSSGEHLNTYSDVVAFAAQSQLITRDDAQWLQAAGARESGVAQGVLRRAIDLRAAIYAIFSALAAGRRPASADVGRLNSELAATQSHARVVPHETGYRWGWAGRNLDAPLWGVSRSAADLLTNDQERPRVRECGGLDCRWLFLDTSKNRTRQWCSMSSCGNRQKARRHYQRRRSPSRTASEANTGNAS